MIYASWLFISVRPTHVSANRILVTVDGSEHSEKAVDLAIDLAGGWNAEIYLIHLLKEKEIPKGFIARASNQDLA